MTWIGEVPFTDLGMTQERIDLLDELAGTNDYWKSARSFLKGVEHREASSLSEKQQDWIENIVASLGVELNRKVAKELFEE